MLVVSPDKASNQTLNDVSDFLSMLGDETTKVFKKVDDINYWINQKREEGQRKKQLDTN